MSFFSGEYFYIVFTVVLLGALILGLLEKPLKWYKSTSVSITKHIPIIPAIKVLFNDASP